jgi:acyl-CoA thioesterase FadM
MTRWLRFLLVGLRSMRRPRLGPGDTSIVTARVWPTDADVSVANNAAYLVFFEMARVDLQLRTGLMKLASKKGWAAPTASISVQFRRPLRRLQKVQVSARLVYWDEKWLYVEQRMARNGETIATALSKSMVIGKEGRIPPTALAEALGMSLAEQSMPSMIEAYQQAERLLREHVDGAGAT